MEALGYEAPGALWGQYEHRKQPKKKPKPVTTGRQGKQNGGANGRNGKRHTVRKRPGAMVERTDQHAAGTMGNVDGGRTVKLTGLTRSAIIGKAWRLKLPAKKASGGTKKQQRAGPRIRPPVFYVATQPAPVIELDFLGLSIDEIRSDECHYPHGGEGAPITFCGQPVEDGSSYCPYHKKLCCHAVAPRRDNYNDFMNFRGVR